MASFMVKVAVSLCVVIAIVGGQSLRGQSSRFGGVANNGDATNQLQMSRQQQLSPRVRGSANSNREDQATRQFNQFPVQSPSRFSMPSRTARLQEPLAAQSQRDLRTFQQLQAQIRQGTQPQQQQRQRKLHQVQTNRITQRQSQQNTLFRSGSGRNRQNSINEGVASSRIPLSPQQQRQRQQAMLTRDVPRLGLEENSPLPSVWNEELSQRNLQPALRSFSERTQLTNPNQQQQIWQQRRINMLRRQKNEKERTEQLILRQRQQEEKMHRLLLQEQELKQNLEIQQHTIQDASGAINTAPLNQPEAIAQQVDTSQTQAVNASFAGPAQMKQERIHQLAGLLGFKPSDLVKVVAELEASKYNLGISTPTDPTGQRMFNQGTPSVLSSSKTVLESANVSPIFNLDVGKVTPDVIKTSEIGLRTSVGSQSPIFNPDVGKVTPYVMKTSDTGIGKIVEGVLPTINSGIGKVTPDVMKTTDPGLGKSVGSLLPTFNLDVGKVTPYVMKTSDTGVGKIIEDVSPTLNSGVGKVTPDVMQTSDTSLGKVAGGVLPTFNDGFRKVTANRMPTSDSGVKKIITEVSPTFNSFIGKVTENGVSTSENGVGTIVGSQSPTINPGVGKVTAIEIPTSDTFVGKIVERLSPTLNSAVEKVTADAMQTSETGVGKIVGYISPTLNSGVAKVTPNVMHTSDTGAGKIVGYVSPTLNSGVAKITPNVMHTSDTGAGKIAGFVSPTLNSGVAKITPNVMQTSDTGVGKIVGYASPTLNSGAGKIIGDLTPTSDSGVGKVRGDIITTNQLTGELTQHQPIVYKTETTNYVTSPPATAVITSNGTASQITGTFPVPAVKESPVAPNANITAAVDASNNTAKASSNIYNAGTQLSDFSPPTDAQLLLHALLGPMASLSLPKDTSLSAATHELLMQIHNLISTNNTTVPLDNYSNNSAAIPQNNSVPFVKSPGIAPTKKLGVKNMQPANTTTQVPVTFAEIGTGAWNITGNMTSEWNVTMTTPQFTTTDVNVTTTVVTEATEAVPTAPPPEPGFPYMYEALPGQELTEAQLEYNEMREGMMAK